MTVNVRLDAFLSRFKCYSLTNSPVRALKKNRPEEKSSYFHIIMVSISLTTISVQFYGHFFYHLNVCDIETLFIARSVPLSAWQFLWSEGLVLIFQARILFYFLMLP